MLHPFRVKSTDLFGFAPQNGHIITDALTRYLYRAPPLLRYCRNVPGACRRVASIPLDDIEIVIGEFSPLALYFAFELLPIPFDLIPVHFVLLSVLNGPRLIAFHNLATLASRGGRFLGSAGIGLCAMARNIPPLTAALEPRTPLAATPTPIRGDNAS